MPGRPVAGLRGREVTPVPNQADQTAGAEAPDSPVWIRIDPEAIGANVRRILAIIGPDVELMAVVKANAYGHGATRVAGVALAAGAARLGVARLDEARALRRAGFGQPMLVLGYTSAAQAESAVSAECDLTVFDLETIAALERAARSAGRQPTVHLKLDTGMGRIGAHVRDAAGLARTIAESEWLVLGGTFTHLGRADALDKSGTLGQLARFDRALASIRKLGIDPGTVHAANSAATVSIPAAHYDMVRCGVAVYGIDPSPVMGLPDGFVPALSMYARVAQVKELPAGSFARLG